jgi:hypothetical protein
MRPCGLIPIAAMLVFSRYAPAQNAPTPVYCQVLERKVNDLVYDPVSKRLYASLPSLSGFDGNSVLPIDPITVRPEKPIFVGSEPTKLAVSSDGRFLYAVLSGANSIRRVNLPARKADMEFSVGNHEVGDIQVFPGISTSIVVTLHEPHNTPYTTPVIYDDGQPNPCQLGNAPGSTTLAFGKDASHLYGYEGWLSSFRFTRYLLNGPQWDSQMSVRELMTGYGGQMKYAGERLYTDKGLIIDPERGLKIGAFADAHGEVQPDLAAKHVVFVFRHPDDRVRGKTGVGTIVRLYDPERYVIQDTIEIPDIVDDPHNLVRWGINCYAFTAGNKIVMFSLYRNAFKVAEVGPQHP